MDLVEPGDDRRGVREPATVCELEPRDLRDPGLSRSDTFFEKIRRQHMTIIDRIVTRLKSAGVDGFFTDHPGRAVQSLRPGLRRDCLRSP